jgi:formamidopyrimidine-DNA glycosylase
MPELPEVETVCASLRAKVEGRTIVDVHSPNGYERAIVFSQEARDALRNARILEVRRRGKYILFLLSSGVLVVHLRMTGRLMDVTPDEMKHVSGLISFNDGGALWFYDVRKFGRISWFNDIEEFERSVRLGIEPLCDEFSPDYLYNLLRVSSRAIKPWLLDQRFIAGLGNIYVDESLWSARIHPLSRGSSLSMDSVKILHDQVVNILRESIALHGTSFLSFYFDNDKQGSYAEFLKVFGRQGTPCPRCGALIAKIRVAQRGTHICLVCQVDNLG